MTLAQFRACANRGALASIGGLFVNQNTCLVGPLRVQFPRAVRAALVNNNKFDFDWVYVEDPLGRRFKSCEFISLSTGIRIEIESFIVVSYQA